MVYPIMKFGGWGGEYAAGSHIKKGEKREKRRFLPAAGEEGGGKNKFIAFNRHPDEGESGQVSTKDLKEGMSSNALLQNLRGDKGAVFYLRAARTSKPSPLLKRERKRQVHPLIHT